MQHAGTEFVTSQHALVGVPLFVFLNAIVLLVEESGLLLFGKPAVDSAPPKSPCLSDFDCWDFSGS